MAAPRAYSTRFIRASGAGSVDYTVPAGMRAVVRTVDAAQYTGTAGLAALLCGGYTVWFGSLPGANSSVHFETRQVVMPGEVIRLTLNGGTQNGVVCGYLFSG